MPDRSTDQPTTNVLPDLKEGASSFGSFYPKNYVLAAFPDDATAAQAGDALRAAGFGADDVVTASGPDVVAQRDVVVDHQGALTRLREQWSRLYTDGAAASQYLLDLAKRGSAFVLAYAPEDTETTRAADALRPFQPSVLRKYGTLTVTDLT